MARTRGAALGVLVSLSLAVAMPALAQKGKGKGGGGGKGGEPIAVTATFRDFPGDNVVPVSPDRITSDCRTGNCPYDAQIGSKGRFVLSTDSGVRPLFLDFTDCALASCTPPFDQGFTSGEAFMRTLPGIDLREMPVDGTRGDLRLKLAFRDAAGNGWFVLFDPFAADCEGTSSIAVSRPSADSWVIEAGESDVACLVRVLRGNKTEFSGRHRMPFQVTVRKK